MKYNITLLLIFSLFIVGNTSAQKKKKNKKIILKALVVDTENNPVQNASVFVDGKKSNVTSDANGRFQIKLKPSVKKVAVFTLFNGIAELNYKGQKEITFVLGASASAKNEALNESTKGEPELVDIGYGKAEKRNLSTSVSNVNKNHLKNASHYNNIFDMIKGEVPGVEVNGSQIVIRGVSSFSSDNQPLFVVDGSPVNTVSNLSPNDVKSISILKGGAAAIYGSRGMNGVILIQLKTGGDR